MFIPFSFPFQLKWSPQGFRIAYLALSDFGSALWVLNVKDGTTEPLVKGVSTFAWYLDDNTIICSRKSDNSQKSNDLLAINLLNGKEQILSRDMALTEMFTSKD